MQGTAKVTLTILKKSGVVNCSGAFFIKVPKKQKQKKHYILFGGKII